MIHGYFFINYRIVWDVVINKIPTLKQEIEKLLKE
nr:HepT-like ribonuclease domain-containing protein [Parageobacillus thermantarcticus]